MKRRRYRRRGPGERFLRIPFDLLIKLPEHHLTVLIDMCKRHNGRNNGVLGYGWRDANKVARVSRGGHILDDLRQWDIIKLTRDASFNMKTGRRTREWEIPFLATDNPASKGKRTLHLDYWLLDSIAFSRLTAGEKKLLVELMRRYDGGNNGKIEFGIESGASVGLSRTRTSRALSNLERLGFIIETAAADPQHQRPRRWRLTMYPAGGRPPTKDFMAVRPVPENPFRGCYGATETPVSAALVQPSKTTAGRISGRRASQIQKNINPAHDLAGSERSEFGFARAAQSAPIGFTGAAHIEASQGLPRAQRASGSYEAMPILPQGERPDQQPPAASPSSSGAGESGPADTTLNAAQPSTRRRASTTADARQGNLFPNP